LYAAAPTRHRAGNESPSGGSASPDSGVSRRLPAPLDTCG
jgi:hypothetical protein